MIRKLDENNTNVDILIIDGSIEMRVRAEDISVTFRSPINPEYDPTEISDKIYDEFGKSQARDRFKELKLLTSKIINSSNSDVQNIFEAFSNAMKAVGINTSQEYNETVKNFLDQGDKQ
jgi:hypothetical protein